MTPPGTANNGSTTATITAALPARDFQPMMPMISAGSSKRPANASTPIHIHESSVTLSSRHDTPIATRRPKPTRHSPKASLPGRTALASGS